MVNIFIFSCGRSLKFDGRIHLPMAYDCCCNDQASKMIGGKKRNGTFSMRARDTILNGGILGVWSYRRKHRISSTCDELTERTLNKKTNERTHENRNVFHLPISFCEFFLYFDFYLNPNGYTFMKDVYLYGISAMQVLSCGFPLIFHLSHGI